MAGAFKYQRMFRIVGVVHDYGQALRTSIDEPRNRPKRFQGAGPRKIFRSA
jgi:hypothetical protein